MASRLQAGAEYSARVWIVVFGAISFVADIVVSGLFTLEGAGCNGRSLPKVPNSSPGFFRGFLMRSKRQIRSTGSLALKIDPNENSLTRINRFNR